MTQLEIAGVSKAFGGVQAVKRDPPRVGMVEPATSEGAPEGADDHGGPTLGLLGP